MAGGSYFEVEARVVSPGIVARVLALVEAPAQAIERRLQEAIRRGLEGGGSPGTSGARAGLAYGEAFSRTLKTKLEAAFRSLPDIKLKADSSDVDRELLQIRNDIQRILTDDTYRLELGISDEDVQAKLRLLRNQLERLSRTSPDIRVRVNAGTALAELEALKRATDGFGRSNVFGRLRLQTRQWLDEARQGSTLFDTIAGKVGVVTTAIGGASNNLYVALGVAAAIVALISTLGPLIAGAAGGLIGFVGVAGVAVLAVKGLMDSASSGIGKYISDQLNSIQDQFRSLAAIAGEAIAPAVRDVLSTAQRVFATLGPVVEIIAGRLGGAVRLLGTALLDGIQKASPLFVEVAGYIEDGAAALRRWVAGPSFTKFIDYAREQLPVVIDFAKDFGKAIIDTLVSLAPIGEVVIKILDKVFEGISKLANSNTLLAVLGALTGPLGAVVGAAGSLFSVLAGGDDDVKSTSNATDDLLASVMGLGDALPVSTDRLEQYGEALGPGLLAAVTAASEGTSKFYGNVENLATRLQNASTANQVWLDAVKSFDPATATAADTASLFGAALTASRGDLLDYTATMLGADTATQALGKAISENLSSISDAGTLLGQSYLDASGNFVAGNAAFTEGSTAVASALQAQVKAATDAATATFQHEKALGNDKKAADDALAVYKGYRQELIDQAVEAGKTKEAATALADQYFAIPPSVDTFVDMLGAGSVNLAILGLTEALNRLSDIIALPAVGLNITDFNNSKATADRYLNDFAYRKTTTSLDLSTGAFDSGIAGSNTALDVLNGRTATATVNLNDYASYKLRGIAGLLLSLPNSKTIYVNTVTGGNTGTVNAAGNIYKAYAAGGLSRKVAASYPHFAAGIEKHVPQIARGGMTRIWNEPETHGEAYIPLANDWRRARALQIWAQTGREIGAIRPMPQGASGGGGPVEMTGTMTLDTGSMGTLAGRVRMVADQSYAANTANAAFQNVGPGRKF